MLIDDRISTTVSNVSKKYLDQILRVLIKASGVLRLMRSVLGDSVRMHASTEEDYCSILHSVSLFVFRFIFNVNRCS